MKNRSIEELTLNEAAEALSRLERREISASQVRTMLVLGQGAKARHPQRQGHPRLFSAIDLALARILLRLRAAGVSPVVSRVIVATLRDGAEPGMPSLVEHLNGRDPMALAVHGMRGWLVYDKHRPELAIAWVPLRDVMHGIESTMATVRRANGISARTAALTAAVQEPAETR